MKKWLSLLVVVVLVTTVVSSAFAAGPSEDFEWKKYEGTELSVILNKHPYSESLIGLLPAFEELTGMKVNYEILAEEEYFEKLRLELSTGTGQYDVFMTGPMLEWEYVAAGWMEPLEDYMADETKTDMPYYQEEDFYQALLAANRWNMNVGSGLGEGHQWAIPVMVETYVIPYRADLLEEYGLEVPKTLPEMKAVAVAMKENNEDENFYGVVTRGLRTMATVATGYLSTMMSYAETDMPDFAMTEDGELKCVINQPALVEATDIWVSMIKEAGPPGWTSITWYDGKELFASGQYGMYPDCDFFAASYENPETSMVAGKVGYTTSAMKPGGEPASAIWTWALAMSAASQNKDAAWYLIQYATSAEALAVGTAEFNNFNPTRASVWDDPDVVALTESWGGGTYREAVGENLAKYARLGWTPEPEVWNVGDRWAEALHEIWTDTSDAQTALDTAAEDIEMMLEMAEVVPGPLPNAD